MWKDKKRELKKFEPFRVGGVSHAVQTWWAEAGAGAGVIRWPDFRHARRGKWPKSQIIGATDRCPKIWIIDVQSPLNVQLPSTDWLPICLFCKCDYHHHCQLLAKVIAECVQRRVTAGKKNPANEDPQSTMRIRGWFGKIWTIGRKMLGAGRDKGEEEHAKPFLSSDFSLSPKSNHCGRVNNCLLTLERLQKWNNWCQKQLLRNNTEYGYSW